MWIKDANGDYINMDHVPYIYLDYEGHTCAHVDGCEHDIYYGDIRDEIIKNVISGTPVMEVL